jgi:hypothetical protein
MQMMRFIPGGGSFKEPQVSTVAVQGNRMVRKGPRQTEVIDLDKRTITRINSDKHTWSEITFDQMKQQLEQVSEQARQKSGQTPEMNVNVDADLKQTGQSRNVNGYEASEAVMSFSMAGTDPQSGAGAALKVTSDMWLASNVPGYSETREFYARMAKELDWAPTGMGAFMNRPDIAKAMAKMMAAGGKMNGTPIEQIMKISAEGAGMPQGQQPAAAAPRPSVNDAIASALGGKLGGLGGFGRHKKQDTPKQDDASPQQPPADAQAPVSSSDNSLIEMTVDNANFSSGAVDPSLFEVPAGFKKVEEDYMGRREKK